MKSIKINLNKSVAEFFLRIKLPVLLKNGDALFSNYYLNLVAK